MFILPYVLLSKLVINFVITRGRDCLWSYLGQPWNTSLYPTRCEEPPEWAACVGCKVHNGIQEKETLLLRGLCQKTKFDTQYQGNVYSYYFMCYCYVRKERYTSILSIGPSCQTRNQNKVKLCLWLLYWQ